MKTTALALFVAAFSCGWLVAHAAPADIKLLPETVKLRSSALPGYAIAMQKCGICHSADYIAYQPPGMSLSQWTAEMTKMQHAYGAPISEGDIKQIGAYLAVAYGSAKASDADVLAVVAQALPAAKAVPAAAATSSAASSTAGKIDVQTLLAKNACLSCHGLTQKIVGPAYNEVATKYKSDPQAIAKLQASIRNGSTGKWGQMPMPPFASLKPDELQALTGFVMKQ